MAGAGASGGTTAVYLVDNRRHAIRVQLPRQDPCHRIRAEVAALLPAADQPAEATFEARRPAR